MSNDQIRTRHKRMWALGTESDTEWVQGICIERCVFRTAHTRTHVQTGRTYSVTSITSEVDSSKYGW